MNKTPALSEVLKAFGVTLQRPRRVLAGRNNEHWYVGPDYVLRRYREPRSLVSIAYEHTVLAYVAERGWPVATPLSTPGGDAVVESDGRRYALFRRLPGRRGKPEAPRNPREMGRLLARLHADLATFEVASPADIFPPVLDLREGQAGPYVDPSLLALLQSRDPAAARAVRAARYSVLADLSEVPVTRLPRTLVHGDWHAGNLLMQHGLVCGVLDFDNVHPDLRVVDAGIACTVLTADLAVDFLAGYSQVAPLARDELRLIGAVQRARLLMHVDWYLGTWPGAADASVQGVRLGLDLLARVDERWPELKARLGL